MSSSLAFNHSIPIIISASLSSKHSNATNENAHIHETHNLRIASQLKIQQSGNVGKHQLKHKAFSIYVCMSRFYYTFALQYAQKFHDFRVNYNFSFLSSSSSSLFSCCFVGQLGKYIIKYEFRKYLLMQKKK